MFLQALTSAHLLFSTCTNSEGSVLLDGVHWDSNEHSVVLTAYELWMTWKSVRRSATNRRPAACCALGIFSTLSKCCTPVANSWNCTPHHIIFTLHILDKKQCFEMFPVFFGQILSFSASLMFFFPFMCFSVLDLPLCQDTQDFDDKALHPNPVLWSPKTRRLEVSVIPRPRPSPIRPRIDPWSFISAGGGNSGGGRSPHRSESNLLSYQPSPTNPFTNCDPFPSPDCDPFALKADPSSGSDGASPFDPFSAPFPTSRSAPCSANGSPTLPSFRIAPINSADSALIDFGCGACNKPLDGTKERAHPRRILGLKPFKSPTQLKDDRFWIQPCPDKEFILNDRCYEPGFDCRSTVQDRFHYYVLLWNKDSDVI